MAWFIVLLIFLNLCHAARGDYTDPHCGGKQVIVHLFEWKWTDVARECERILGPYGFCGVQVSPPNEHEMVFSKNRPWWERYRPVSYKLHSRSGNEAQFTDMVQRCNKVGVRIYVDAVINHMAPLGSKGTGTAGSWFDADARRFPAVPYSYLDFNSRDRCPSSSGNVDDYNDAKNVRNCFLLGLTDLNQGKEYVRKKIVGYYNRLIDLGVAGFRVDAAKHMWPGDLEEIQRLTKGLPGGGKPFFYHEVIDQNGEAVKAADYTGLGYVTEFRFCQKIAWAIRDFSQLGNVVDRGWNMLDSDRAFVFIDNHDNQRGHGGGGGNLLTHKTPREYKMAAAFMLAYNYGFARLMSSYYFTNPDQGPPRGQAGPDGGCGKGWVCEHRWPPIANMVRFRNAVAGADVRFWTQREDFVAFARGSKGFFAMTRGSRLDSWFSAGLPAGSYCNIIANCRDRVTVDSNGRAHVVISDYGEPMVAFYVGSGSDRVNWTVLPQPRGTVPMFSKSWRRTAIMVHYASSPGEDLFIRGGVGLSHKTGCMKNTASSNCSIPIKYPQEPYNSFYARYSAWVTGDTKLDWYGAEAGQGKYHNQKAEGTPAKWTTNNPNKLGYNSHNKYGDDYWLVDFSMMCGQSNHGWFELKAFVNNHWENDINNAARCTGGMTPPYLSKNHMALCGYLNVFHYAQGSCTVVPL